MMFAGGHTEKFVNRPHTPSTHSSKILTIQQGISRGVSSVGKPCRPEHGFPRPKAEKAEKSLLFTRTTAIGFLTALHYFGRV